ncbi:hypothetical protein L2E82_40361 [Cichorium intybus]|uniref:Uncharacterized protein n=1 Tax=Cichorium intybus TaxID=13427 RepID=A0ACB9AL50_CICIN|nr:hypothetical protein L2E82_40361 [Cichorium intybus]
MSEGNWEETKLEGIGKEGGVWRFGVYVGHVCKGKEEENKKVNSWQSSIVVVFNFKKPCSPHSRLPWTVSQLMVAPVIIL